MLSKGNTTLFKNRRRGVALASLLVLLWTSAGASDEWTFDGVQRIVAVSDVHGAYDAMVRTFQQSGVIADDLTWSGGATHLVITGDLLDRGPDSRKIMDLIMGLEADAQAAGGRVHQLIGNHEVMNLAGDLRYVSRREYAAFADDESEEERERWFLHYSARQPADSDEAALRQQFDKLAPPGFFGHRRAFRADGHYGSWLLEKPLMVVINGTAFVHGGVSPYVAEHGLEGVNGTLGSELARYVTALNVLEDAGQLSPMDSLYSHAKLLEAAMLATPFEGSEKTAADTVIALSRSEIHGSDSPLWYRGTVGCNELVEGDVLEAAFARIGANRVVIGHTPTITRQVLQRMDGRVIEIDTGMLNSAYKGSGNALLIEGDTLTVINESGVTTSPPVEHPRRVGQRSETIDAARLAEIMRAGDITDSSEDSEGRMLVRVTLGEDTVHAYFDKLPRKKGFVPELAAYRLDLLLELDMVPVTVFREYQGEDGTLQFFPATEKSEQERTAEGSGSSAWCPLPKQWNAMYIYDVLIANPGRLPVFMLYSTDNWSMFLVEHDQAFGTSKGRPAYLKNVELNIGNEWVEKLRALNNDVLATELGDVLDKRRLSALGKRRDALIKDATAD